MSMLRVLVAFITIVVPAHALAAPALDPDGSGPRIRPYDGRVAAALVDGLRRSPTLRAMVDRIELGDVIVYLETRHSLEKDHLAGVLTWLTATPAFRYVRVSINPELPRNTAIATLGHELQHVLEVVSDPSIVSSASMEVVLPAARHQHAPQHERMGQPARTRRWATMFAAISTAAARRMSCSKPPTRSIRSTWNTVYRTARESGR